MRLIAINRLTALLNDSLAEQIGFGINRLQIILWTDDSIMSDVKIHQEMLAVNNNTFTTFSSEVQL